MTSIAHGSLISSGSALVCEATPVRDMTTKPFMRTVNFNDSLPYAAFHFHASNEGSAATADQHISDGFRYVLSMLDGENHIVAESYVCDYAQRPERVAVGAYLTQVQATQIDETCTGVEVRTSETPPV